MEGIVQLQNTAHPAAISFEATVGEFYPGLVRRLTAVLHDPEGANDIAQEAYLRAYRSWDRFDGTDARAWLFTIALRLAFNERRRRRRWNVRGDRVGRVDSLRVADLDLHAALRALRPEHRAALLLSIVDGYTQAEIASMLQVAPGTVASWLSRAKAHLREKLTDA